MPEARPRPRLVLAEPPATLDALFREHARYVATVAHRILGRSDEVDDVVQDVFLAAERGLGQLRDPDALRGWLATVAVRLARRRLRHRRLFGWLGFDDAPSYLDVIDPGASPADRTMIARIYVALDRLPVGDRVAWTLRHLEGEPLERVASLCGCSLATAKRRIQAAQTRLRREIDG